MELGETGLRRGRIAAQLLDGRNPPGRVEDVVGAVVGVQAQDQLAAALSIRARSAGLVRSDVERSLTDDRSVVLTWSLRGTRHYHRAEDVRWLVGLLGPVFDRSAARARQLGIDGAVGDRAVEVLREALAAEGPLTRDDVKQRLAPHGVDPEAQAAVHVIWRAALEGVLCVVPGTGGAAERYVLVDDWVAKAKAMDPEAAVVALARRYLAGFGPATPADFAAWSGLGTKPAAAAWSALGPELTEVRVRVRVGGAGPAWVLSRAEEAMREAAADRAPLRLVGGFDSMVLGYADRRAHLDPAHARDVNRGGGMIHPTVVDDGRIVGTWRYRPGGRIEVRPFGPVSRRAVDAEARDVGRFLGLPQVRTEMPIPPGVVAP